MFRFDKNEAIWAPIMTREEDRGLNPNPKRRRGRPSIQKTKGDFDLERKALRLRRDDMSWTQISNRLVISRTTARRLCQKAQNAQDGQSNGKTKEWLLAQVE